jgi:hypothetical protein
LGIGDYTVLLTTKLGVREYSLDAAGLQLRKEVVRPKLSLAIKVPIDGKPVSSPVVGVKGEVSDGDAKVVVNGILAQVTGDSAKASTFALSRLNLSSCTAKIEAKATRGTKRLWIKQWEKHF